MRTAVEVIVEEVRDHSADTASFTTELLRRYNDPSPGVNIELLLADAKTPAQFVETVTTVLAAARIPARMIRGVILQDQQRRVEPTPWLEVHDGDRWRYFSPNTGALISGLYIPHWDFILQTAARGLEVTGLGYLGVDIVFDRDRGPLILEMNARPGLNIQIANCTGLSTRIDRIDEIFDPEAYPA
ncbi:protein of unknown function [uncultured Woeseiaceae bacterium]|uniref:ATP-grasp domain-containing protein n=1 Tax=uncultured Woeseiaceae bacterium TaxID=1983305 RepID=A0A7D9H591_9GAMM|nr:protein of unknown function [uncultured Woeseiaceae bacterium]